MFNKDAILRLRSMNDVLALPDDDFEWFCKYLLPYRGHERIAVTKKHGKHRTDGGIDLTTYCQGEKMLVQCKRWRRGIGGFLPIRIIRELGGCMLREGLKRGMVIAPLKFSLTDYREARRMNIELVGTKEIADTMAQINPHFLA